MKVITKKRLLGYDRKCLVENGRAICKAQFDDINIYRKHNIDFVEFTWFVKDVRKSVVLPLDSVCDIKSCFGVKELVDNNDILILHYDNFTVRYNTKTFHITIYDAKGDVQLRDIGSYFKHSNTSISYSGDYGAARAVVLNGDRLERFAMSSQKLTFLEPYQFYACNEYSGDWTDKYLKAEMDFVKAIIKNDLKSWDRWTYKNVVNIGNPSKIVYEKRSFDQERALQNAKEVVAIIGNKVKSIKNQMAKAKEREDKKEELRQEIDVYCDQLDGETFGV